MSWVTWAFFGLAGLCLLLTGFVFGTYVMAKVLQDEWRELRELLAPAAPPVETPQDPEWGMRVSPENYLKRFPEGIHAPQARQIVERRERAERQRAAAV